jgi:serine/threonine protein kinase
MIEVKKLHDKGIRHGNLKLSSVFVDKISYKIVLGSFAFASKT